MQRFILECPFSLEPLGPSYEKYTEAHEAALDIHAFTNRPVQICKAMRLTILPHPK